MKAVLFDLDGTLIDTAPDFIRIIKELCAEASVTPPADEVIRVQVSEGSKAMVRALHPELSDDSPELIGYRNEFLRRYAENIAVHTTLFDGMDEVLRALEAKGIPWGIVTNKPRGLSALLLEAMHLSERCAVLVCPDDVRHTKPDPEPMYLAAKILGISPEDIVYVGDHPRDIDAGRAAGMQTILAAYGYLPPERADDLASWQADFIVHHAKELQALWAA
ncbi:phosphoglycolate phosphatase [Aquirhabdus parva]|uniref:phosphoglycolate phosphatase n=1 Tax=Aquirhabdus parva TaxID=2283318 RepID=A0A345PAZ7_9GAMM|nr:phosphoglycolate phosphatase [Aquirhabdus parva]AXI04456.1 phosphoglycolate phosphatase [Aquirhabdus parva]